MSVEAQVRRLPEALSAGDAIVVTSRLEAPLAAETRTALATWTSSLRPAPATDESLYAYALAGHVMHRRPSQLALSVSHASRSVAIAIARRGEIGVDVEHVAPLPRRVAERVLEAEDVAGLLALDAAARDRAFAILWTVAEACAIGAST